MSPSELQRPLSPAEVGAWVMDKSASMNYCLVARVRGGLARDTLRVALDAVQARHPALRARVEEHAGQLQFRSDGVGALPLVVEQVGDVTDFPVDLHGGCPAKSGVAHKPGSGIHQPGRSDGDKQITA